MAGDKNYTALRSAGTCSVTDPAGATVESDTLQCVHCQHVWIVQPGSGRVRGWCARCHGPTCSAACSAECVPFEQWLENVEAGRPANYYPTAIYVGGIGFP